MAGDPFSSNPYPARKVIMAEFHYCEHCDKEMKARDKAAHDRGKKHVEKVHELNAGAIGINERIYVPRKAAPAKDACHNCGKSGHMSRDCTEPRKFTGECRGCGQTGHMSKDCPNKTKRACFNCGEEGHRKGECSNPRQIICNNCKNPGHMSKDCPEPRNLDNVQCRNCEKMGHFSKDCTEKKDWSKVRCNNCGEMGHTQSRCNNEPLAPDSTGWDTGATTATTTTEPWADGQNTNAANGSWDDSAPIVEAKPANSWDDSVAPVAISSATPFGSAWDANEGSTSDWAAEVPEPASVTTSTW